MSLFGRNVQAVTANSTTTAESTTGAPIGTWARVNGGGTGSVTPANSPNSHFGNTSAGTRASIDATMYANDTPNAFTGGQSVGVFGVTPTQMSNNSVNASKEHPAHAGWVLRRAGTGGIATAAPTVTGGGTNFANGETILLSNATSNATLTVTTNSQGNAVTLAVTVPGGGWVNTTMVANAFIRQLHVANITGTVSGNGYNNADIVTVSNVAGAITPAVFKLSTSANGQIANSNMLASNGTNALNVGLFANSQTNAGVTFAITNSTGGTAAGNSTTTALAVNLIPSTGGAFTITLGGRAGRVQTETIIAAGSLGAQSAGFGTPATTNGSGSGTTSQIYYPGP